MLERMFYVFDGVVSKVENWLVTEWEVSGERLEESLMFLDVRLNCKDRRCALFEGKLVNESLAVSVCVDACVILMCMCVGCCCCEYQRSKATANSETLRTMGFSCWIDCEESDILYKVLHGCTN